MDLQALHPSHDRTVSLNACVCKFSQHVCRLLSVGHQGMAVAMIADFEASNNETTEHLKWYRRRQKMHRRIARVSAEIRSAFTRPSCLCYFFLSRNIRRENKLMVVLCGIRKIVDS